MDCRRFRDQHALLIDQRCSALEENELREHMRSCAKCARHDTAVRRSLLLVRNLPDIQPSPDFRARLEARLRAGAQPVELRRPRRPRLTTGAYAAVAATVVFVAALAAGAIRRSTVTEIRMAPVVASTSESESSFASTALVATVPTGMSVWPAIMAASQAPFHFVAAEMASER